MTINFSKYKDQYTKEDGGKTLAKDFFDLEVHLLPFATNTGSCKYDINCGFSGVTGEFFRKGIEGNINAIADVEKAIEDVRKYLIDNDKLDDKNKIDTIISVVSDILISEKNRMNVIDSSFLKYQPLFCREDDKNNKFKHGQQRMADYLLSMLDANFNIEDTNAKNNIVNTIIKDALDSKDDGLGKKEDGSYQILPFVKTTFNEDIAWLFSQEDSVLRKNIDKFLHFYLCYSITQTILAISIDKLHSITDKPEELFYILTTEHVTDHSEAVTNGWHNKLHEKILKKIFGQLQTIDILNTVIDKNEESEPKPMGFYSEVMSYLNAQQFSDEDKENCEMILKTYKDAKSNTIKGRNSDKKSGAIAELDEYTKADSYEEFVKNLYTLCIRLCSSDYETKMKSNVYDVMKMRFLQTRRLYNVLTLDEDMLVFLVAMIVKNERLRLEDVYGKFASRYGIRFNMATRNVIEQILLNYNILDRKSDSGEVQYVSVIL